MAAVKSGPTQHAEPAPVYLDIALHVLFHPALKSFSSEAISNFVFRSPSPTLQPVVSLFSFSCDQSSLRLPCQRSFPSIISLPKSSRLYFYCTSPSINPIGFAGAKRTHTPLMCFFIFFFSIFWRKIFTATKLAVLGIRNSSECGESTLAQSLVGLRSATV